MIASTTTPVSRLSVRHANASRRGSIAAAGLVDAVGAHIAVSGELDVIPIAPAIWAMLICAVALLGVRTAVFSKRAWPVTLALVVGSQLAMHVGMVKAPWAFGLRIHHEAVLITPSALIAHAIGTIVLVAGICWLERVLGVLSRVVRAVRNAAPRPPRPAQLAVRIEVPTPPRIRAVGLRRATSSRGPPLPV